LQKIGLILSRSQDEVGSDPIPAAHPNPLPASLIEIDDLIVFVLLVDQVKHIAGKPTELVGTPVLEAIPQIIAFRQDAGVGRGAAEILAEKAADKCHPRHLAVPYRLLGLAGLAFVIHVASPGHRQAKADPRWEKPPTQSRSSGLRETDFLPFDLGFGVEAFIA